MYKNFENYMLGVIDMHGSISKTIFDLTDKLVELRNKPNNSEISQILPDKLICGRFYLIQYNFNGNLIWCPILALEYKVINNKSILYAVNLEYLPPRYKILFFNNIFKNFVNQMNTISEEKLTINERPLDFINFENIYKLLKNNKMEYAITAYTIKDFNGNYKIKKSYVCSIKIAPEIIMADMKRFNRVDMLKLHKSIEGKEQVKLGEIIEQYKLFIEGYQADSVQYHKTVALFREKLKLFKD